MCSDSLFIYFLQHVVFGICRLIDILVPDVPESLEIKIKRERYLAKQALADTETIMKVRSVCLIVAYVTVCSHTALTTATASSAF